MSLYKSMSFLAQAVTAGLAIAFVVLLLKPEWLPTTARVIEIKETAPQTLPPAAAMGQGPVSYADAVALATPAVVNIYTAKVITRNAHPLLDDPVFRQFFGDRFSTPRKQLETSLGSGVMLSEQGYVLTNNHVIDGADEIQVMLSDGRSSRATVVGVDPDTDLAVLKVTLDKLSSLVLGSSQNLRVGDVVLAIGNPFGVGQTVTLGIVSATGRHQLGINTFEDFIQTDAAINPGNSGGALINARGELVGINTAIYSRTGGSQGIGFAIPIQLAKGVMQQIIEKGQVTRGWLGIEAQDLTPALMESFSLDSPQGMLVAGILRGGPAEQAGLEPGDIILVIDDQRISNARDAVNFIAQQPPKARLHIEGIRQGKAFSTDAVVGSRPMGTR